MATTGNIDMTLLEEGQNNADITVNSALARLDALITKTVISETSTPPGSPTNGDRYLVGASATGDWAGQDGKIAYYYNQWIFQTVPEGWILYNTTDDTFKVHLGSGSYTDVVTSASFALDQEIGLTASTVQSQGETPLTQNKPIHEVSNVSNANDVVTLPTAVAGKFHVVINNGANTLQIFPASGDKIGTVAVDNSVSLDSGESGLFFAFDTTGYGFVKGGTGGGLGDMQAANNLSDVASIKTSRTNIGLGVVNGFLDRDDSEISVVDGTRTFSVSVKAPATEFEFWSDSVKYTKNSTQSVVFPDTEGVHHFYFDAAGTLVTTQAFDENTIILVGTYVANLYWDADANETIFLGEERHGFEMAPVTHATMHNNFGSQYNSGGDILTIQTDGTGDDAADAQIELDTIVFRDEDIRHEFSDGSPQDLSPIAQIPVFWHEGSDADWRKSAANDYPIMYGGREPESSGDRVNYNELVGSLWQLTEVTNGNFMLMHIFITNEINHPYIAIVGQNEYSTIANARAGAETELNSLVLGGLPFQEFVPLYTLIVETNNGYANIPEARFRTTDAGDDFIDWRDQPSTAGGGSGGGTTLPVNDTVALVRDPADNSKQVRIDAGSVPTSSTVVLTAPATDLDLADVITDNDFAGSHEGRLVRTGANAYAVHRHNLTATTAPATSNDTTENYAVGSIWIDTTNDRAYICVDATTSAAVWKEIGGGTILGYEQAEVTSTGSTTGQIPTDDSIPQSGEGGEVLTLNYTAKNANSKLLIICEGFAGHNNASTKTMAASLLVDSAQAFAARAFGQDQYGVATFCFSQEYEPGDTSLHTYRLRLGHSATSTTTRWAGTPFTGVNMFSTNPKITMTILEIKQ